MIITDIHLNYVAKFNDAYGNSGSGDLVIMCVMVKVRVKNSFSNCSLHW